MMQFTFGPDLGQAIGRLSRASVLVIGDAMLDRYVFGKVRRISPEAPVPVLAVDRELALPGGAGNVVRNLTALGAAAALVSVVGDDQAGSDLTGLIGGQLNVEPWLLVQSDRCTTVKTRYIAEGQQLLRSDQEVTAPIHPKLAERMLRIASDALAATSVTVLSDYAKGVLVRDVPARIIEAARKAGRRVVVDSRGPDFDRFAGADVVLLTAGALEKATGFPVATEAELASAARWLRTANGFGAVVVSRRGEGFLLAEDDRHAIFPIPPGEVFDFTGCGDAATASIAAGLASGRMLTDAVRIACVAVAACASRPGMAVADAAELQSMLTPQGRAMRKVLPLGDVAEQAARWRNAGLRVGMVLASEAELPLIPWTALRGGCDRLVLALTSEEEPLAAAAAVQPEVDLVCLAGGTEAAVMEDHLRPDVVFTAEAASERFDP